MIQLLGFLIVGAVTLLIDVLTTSICFRLLGFPSAVASGCGFMSGFFFNFPVNRKVIFAKAEQTHYVLRLRNQVIGFIILSVANLFISSVIVGELVDLGGTEIEIAKLIVTAAIAVWNFIILRTVIFRTRA